MTARAVATSEAPAAPILLSLYDDAGLVGRAELTPRQALRLVADLARLIDQKDRAGPGVGGGQ
jgi:hypothetical protein